MSQERSHSEISNELLDWSRDPLFDKRIGAILENLRNRVEALGDGNPYWSVVYFTPQGNPHSAYCNGAVKPQGEAAPDCPSTSLKEDDIEAAFNLCAESTFAAIAADKPKDRSRLIWRVQPESGMALKSDGLHVKIYTRIGWDKSED